MKTHLRCQQQLSERFVRKLVKNIFEHVQNSSNNTVSLFDSYMQSENPVNVSRCFSDSPVNVIHKYNLKSLKTSFYRNPCDLYIIRVVFDNRNIWTYPKLDKTWACELNSINLNWSSSKKLATTIRKLLHNFPQNLVTTKLNRFIMLHFL